MKRKRALAEELISVTKKFCRMFLEQTVADMGEVPTNPIEGEGINISADEVGAEAYGDVAQEIVSKMRDLGVEDVEAEGVTTFVLKKDGKEITFEVGTIDSEPVVAIYTESGRITVSLAPLIGYVQSAEDAVEKIANDGSAMEEFSGLVGEVAGVEVDVESDAGEGPWYSDGSGEGEEEIGMEDGESDVDDTGEYGELEGDSEEGRVDLEGEDKEYEEVGFEDEENEEEDEEDNEDEEVGFEGENEEKENERNNVRESLRKRLRALRLREQTDQHDMAAGRRDITVGMIQDSDKRIGSIPVKDVDVFDKRSGEDVGVAVAYPNLYALFREKEGVPDIEGMVREEVPSSDDVGELSNRKEG
jgi:hypothetical protein